MTRFGGIGPGGVLLRRRGDGAVALLLLALAATGCMGVGGGSIPETRYFVIDYSVEPVKNAGPVLPVSVGVVSFRSDAVYRSEKIVFRKVPYRVDFYPYERWGARPDEIVTDRLIDHLLAARRFREVVRASGGARTDYLVRGRVKRFEEVNSPPGRYSAVAQIEFSVVYRRTGAMLLQERLMRSTLAKSKPPQGFVNAMAENLKGLLGEAADRIADAIGRHRRRPGPHP